MTPAETVRQLYELVVTVCGAVAPAVRPWEAWSMPFELLVELCEARGRLIERERRDAEAGRADGDGWTRSGDGTKSRRVGSMDDLKQFLGSGRG